MSHWSQIRAQAQAKHLELFTTTGNNPSAEALLSAADTETGLQRIPVPANDPLLYGTAEAVLHSGIIWFNKDVERWCALFNQAHEYAHFWLHGDDAHCAESDINNEASEDNTQVGVKIVEGYSPHERRELEANVFARELLLPGNILKQWYLREEMSAADIATKVGMPIGMVFHQLSRALLTLDTLPPVPMSPVTPSKLILDQSQERAAYIKNGPVLVEAGPGTGKTSTLVGRILYLLDNCVPPTSILTLTFSNKAAEEMRSRVSTVVPDAAPRIWMGTFHAFGLELLRKYGTRLGLPPKPNVIDPVEAIFLLEHSLANLQLNFYQNLYEPAMSLKDILNAISRAKDELITPQTYTTLAQAMLNQANTLEKTEEANKSLEVARVYSFYQEYLEKENLLDFGDLICRAVNLLHDNPDICEEVQKQYKYFLVDEYQDVNTASRMLLRELAGVGNGLWVVGDAQQAIYRFRGAAPINMQLFTTDFPNAQILPLEINYRSQPVIVNTFSEFARKMNPKASFTSWQAKRSQSEGKVMFEIADNEIVEAEGIARKIKSQKADGTNYKDQAVICRSHTVLARLCAILEREEIPVLYLGDLFERSEVRDLLSLLELSCKPSGSSLVRVAQFDEYKIPLEDVLTLLALASEKSIPFPRALKLAPTIETLSERGLEGLTKLTKHLLEDEICYGNTAWSMLVQYLFGSAHYLRPVLTDNSVRGQQKRLAIYQFLQFAYELRNRTTNGSDPKRVFLEYVRRVAIFGEEKQLRQVPIWAESIDGVRILTVHASKGLEFHSVFLPYLSKKHFPASRQADRCPPPDGILTNTGQDWHNEEEECLFFVALSRARDRLCLSRAVRYGKQNSNASPFLTKVAIHLPRAVDGPTTWKGNKPVNFDTALPYKSSMDSCYTERALSIYMECPRQYYYEFHLNLRSQSDNSAYQQFHHCVYKVLGWIQRERTEGRQVDQQMAQKVLGEIWQVYGPREHIYEPIYWREAEAMVVRAINRGFLSYEEALKKDWEVVLPHGRVSFKPDQVEAIVGSSSRGLLVKRLRTGQRTKSEAEKEIYALYYKAVEQMYPKTKVEIQTLYLSTDEVVLVDITAKKVNTHLEKYDQAIIGIIQKDFTAAPNEKRCPRCPYYFICSGDKKD